MLRLFCFIISYYNNSSTNNTRFYITMHWHHVIYQTCNYTYVFKYFKFIYFMTKCAFHLFLKIDYKLVRKLWSEIRCLSEGKFTTHAITHEFKYLKFIYFMTKYAFHLFLKIDYKLVRKLWSEIRCLSEGKFTTHAITHEFKYLKFIYFMTKYAFHLF